LKLFWEENISLKGTNLEPSVEESFVFNFGRYRLNGRIDRRDHLSEGGTCITDYKTGFARYGEGEMARDIQFTVYSLAEIQKYGAPPNKMSVLRLTNVDDEGFAIIPVPNRVNKDYALLKLYLDEAYIDNLLTSTRRPHDLPLFEGNAEDISINDRSIFTPRPGPECNFCDFQYMCAAGSENAISSLRRSIVDRELEAIYRQGENWMPDQKMLALSISKDKKKKDTEVEKHKRRVKKGDTRIDDLDFPEKKG
jgi:hypothetical protein